ncbi:MAG: hypothetical protein ACLFRG_21650, partial [Desulfococcaceae bacterium]
MDDGSGTFVSEADRVRTIVASGGGHILTESDGRTLSFDADGKLLQIADRNGDAQTVAYAANRLTSIDTLWTIPPDYPATGASYAHDAAGNIVSDGLHTDYFHNQNNRLIRVEIDGATIAEYASERRALKVADGVTTHFHYDLNGLLISETDGNGNPRMCSALIDSILTPKNDRTLPVRAIACRIWGGNKISMLKS